MHRVEWPVSTQKNVKTADLIPYANNMRVHSEKQIGQIKSSIIEWGWTDPILIDSDKVIIAGHGRLTAAISLNIESVPVVIAKGWSEAQKKAFRIAHNKIALNSSWDETLLKIEFNELDELDFDLELSGFELDEIGDLFDEVTQGKTNPDDVPEKPEVPVSIEGDIWILGSHRIICGDSTNPDDVERLLDGVRPHLMVTDPPYGVEYDASWRADVMPEKNNKDGNSEGKVSNDDSADWSKSYELFPGDVAYVWHAGTHENVFAQSLIGCGFELRSHIVWVKNQFVIGRGNYHIQHEPCFYAVRSRKGATAHWKGDRKQTTVWNIDKPLKSETGHSTQKPIDCMRRPIENNSSVGDAVYEPFSGSGTTIIAAEQTGRHCYAIEIVPDYVDIAVKRWEEFTGDNALHEKTGRTFEEMKRDRNNSV